jgi:hypothetical protein
LGRKIVNNIGKWAAAALLLSLSGCIRENSAPILNECYKSRNLIIKFDGTSLNTQDGHIEKYEIVKRKSGWVISSALDVEKNPAGGFKFVKSNIGNYDWFIDYSTNSFTIVSKERDVLHFDKC